MSLWPRLLLNTLTCAALCLSFAVAAQADTFTLINTDSGWYDGSGFHNSTNTNYIAAENDGPRYRNFFVFDLSGLSGTVTSASIQLYTHTVTGTGTYTLYDVSTGVPMLVAGGIGLTSIHNDLGTGNAFGSIGLTTSNAQSLFTLTLNAAAIADIQSRLGGQFAIGGRFDAPSNYVMGFSNFDPRNQLTIETGTTVPTAVPEPATMLLLGTGLAGVAAKVRRRRRSRREG